MGEASSSVVSIGAAAPLAAPHKRNRTETCVQNGASRLAQRSRTNASMPTHRDMPDGWHEAAARRRVAVDDADERARRERAVRSLLSAAPAGPPVPPPPAAPPISATPPPPPPRNRRAARARCLAIGLLVGLFLAFTEDLVRGAGPDGVSRRGLVFLALALICLLTIGRLARRPSRGQPTTARSTSTDPRQSRQEFRSVPPPPRRDRP
jgi:hypothetical protein